MRILSRGVESVQRCASKSLCERFFAAAGAGETPKLDEILLSVSFLKRCLVVHRLCFGASRCWRRRRHCAAVFFGSRLTGGHAAT
jgi:hypothetical protein